MTLTQLQQHLANQVLRRPALLTSGPGDGPDLTLVAALNYGQQQIQNDGDFRCMETHQPVIYKPTTSVYGVALPQAYAAGPPVVRQCKHICSVWNTTGATTDGNTITGTPLPSTPITPSNEDEVNDLRVIAGRRGNSPSSIGYAQRWYEKEMNLSLLYAPAANTILMVDYFGYLKPYANAADHDFFSDTLWQCLTHAAAWYGCMLLWQDDRVAMFEQQYRTMFQQAMALDRQFKTGQPEKPKPEPRQPKPVPVPPQ